LVRKNVVALAADEPIAENSTNYRYNKFQLIGE
jgi:hypothetical protein